jgi:hypothetical protein
MSAGFLEADRTKKSNGDPRCLVIVTYRNLFRDFLCVGERRDGRCSL